MNRLKNTRAYLCGAMDRVTDGGVGWRRRLKYELRDLEIHWLDPTRKPIDIGQEDNESRRQRHIAKGEGDFDFVADEMHDIRRVDLRMVDICDWQPVNLDMDIHACGTYEEIYLANRQKKPVLVHVEQGKEHAPDWLFGTIPHQHIFSSWDDLIRYVRHISMDAEIDRLGRWYFFDWTGE